VVRCGYGDQGSPQGRLTLNTPDPISTPLVERSKEERQWAMIAHLSAFAGLILPFGSLLGPFVVWMLKREEFPFVADQGKEALNFNITMILLAIVCGLLILVLIGIFLLSVLVIFWAVMIVIASIKANEGVTFRYPFTLRWVR
jgi:hypothetical protein